MRSLWRPRPGTVYILCASWRLAKRPRILFQVVSRDSGCLVCISFLTFEVTPHSKQWTVLIWYALMGTRCHPRPGKVGTF